VAFLFEKTESERSAEQRSLRARAAAHALHAQYDSREITKNARAAFLDRFERDVDPTGTLPPKEREQRAAHARKAYMLNLAAKSAKVRAARKAAR
jgi:hypothetical protein